MGFLDNFKADVAKGNILSGQARFCPYCGCKSTLYEYGLLKSYDQFMENE